MNFINDLITTVDSQVNHFTFDVYHSVVATIFPTLTILLILYFAGLGWLVIRALIPLTPMALAWHMLKAVIIFALATHWDYFSLFIVNVFTHGPDHLLGTILGSANTTGATTSSNITNSIAHFWQTANNVFANLWRSSGNDFLLGTIFGFIGYGAVIGVTAIMLFYILMSKLALSVLLVLAPVFLPLFLWENTRALFNGWLQLLVKWALTPLFAYVFIALFIDLMQTQVNTMASTAIPTTANISVFLLLTVIVIGILVQSVKMAAKIADNIHLVDARTQSSFGIPGLVVNTWRQRGGL